MQQKLVQIRENEKSLMKTHESDLLHLQTLKNKNQELERDVFRMQQREKIINNIKLLKAQIPLVNYTESKARYDRAEIDYQSEKDKYQKAKDEVAPIKALIDRVAGENQRAKRNLDQAETSYKATIADVRKAIEKIKTMRVEINTHKRTINDKKRKLPEREAEIEKAVRRIQQIEEQVATPPSSDTSQFESAINEINQEINNLQAEKVEIKDKCDEEDRKKYQINERLKSGHAQMKQLENVKEQRMRLLTGQYPDVARAYEWLKENRHRFSGQVYDPVVLLLNLKDSRYAAQVEQALGGFRSSHLRQFICEKREDYQLMTRICIDQHKMKINVSWPDLDPAVDYRRKPAPTEEIKAKLGMEYYVVDLLDGPKYVIDTLCQDANINLIPVTINPINEQAVVSANLFQKFVAGDTFYNTKTSIYGRRSKQTQTSIIQPARFLDNTIDTDAQANLKEEMRSLQASIQQADIILKELGREHDKIKAKLEEKKHLKEDQQSQKRDVQKRFQQYQQILRKLTQYKAELVDIRKRPEEQKAEIARMEKDVWRMADEEDILLMTYTKLLEKAIDEFEQRNKAAMLYHFMGVKSKTIESFANTQTENLNNARTAMNNAKNQYLTAKKETKEYMETSKTAGNDLPDELREEFNEVVLKWKQEEGLKVTLTELNNKIAEDEGKVSAIRYANADAMSHYQERKQAIETLEAKANQTGDILNKYRIQIQKIKSQWAPLIKELVSRIDEKFSAAFQRINCAGAIQLEESEDFDKWGINILVKFRDSEKLQLLTGQRQSGGERSVSTILYLMSLQDLAASPFRVVDEINQGMDPRNERMIHEQIVQSATRAGTSQYFLITPKLLPDLYYNQRMRVLCIYNIEWLPEKIQPLQSYLDHAKATGIV
ncbi:hypothetical protein BD408DRAFT_171311 [Parasitella parasitica]|nr:hypothetical protein BD408DRAFT_171311 [Parasitella parasitica]